MEKLAVAEHAWENHPQFIGRRPQYRTMAEEGAVGEGGPAHPDDNLSGALQPRWKTGKSLGAGLL